MGRIRRDAEDEVTFMEEEYWRKFLKTGKIRDYLYYRGMMICKQVMDRVESGEGSESDNWRFGNSIR